MDLEVEVFLIPKNKIVAQTTKSKLSKCVSSIIHELVILEFFTLGVSVRLSDRFKVTQNKINFIQNCPQWGLNSQPLDHHSNALPTKSGRNLLGRRFLK